MDAIAEESIRMITHFDAQGMSNLAWACAQLWVAHIPLMDAIAAQALNLIRDSCGNQQELANFAWSNWAILLDKPDVLHSAVRGFKRLHYKQGPPDGRLVGVEWVHMADACGTDGDGNCRIFKHTDGLKPGAREQGPANLNVILQKLLQSDGRRRRF